MVQCPAGQQGIGEGDIEGERSWEMNSLGFRFQREGSAQMKDRLSEGVEIPARGMPHLWNLQPWNTVSAHAYAQHLGAAVGQ